MPIIAKSNEHDFKPIPVGNYQAVCYDLWDIGLQKGIYKGETIISHKVILAWEINELIESEDKFNGKRYVISSWYTLSLGKKSNLKRDLTSWRGKDFTEEELKGFDLENLIGANCMLNIIHDEKNRAKIVGVTGLPKGLGKMTPENQRSIPDWIQKHMDKALTLEEAEIIMAEANGIKNAMKDDDEDMPF